MKVVKTPRANLEKMRFRFFKIGLVVACSFTLVAFNYTSYDLAESDESNVRVPEVDLLEPILPEYSFREQAKPKVVTMSLKYQQIKIEPDEIDLGLEKMISDDVDIDWEGVEGADECDDCDVIDPEIPDFGEKGWIFAERTPYFDECAQPADKAAEAACSYKAIRDYVQSNTKYPGSCREIGISGTVWLSFLVNKKGDVSDVKVLKSPHTHLTEAAIAGLMKLPKMNPGTQRLRPVDVRLEIPVKFILR